MVWVFNPVCKLPAVKQGKKFTKVQQKIYRKQKQILALIQNTIKNEGLLCHEGNWCVQYWHCCTNFFNNSAVPGRRLNLETSMIQLFRDQLIDMNNRTKRPDKKVSCRNLNVCCFFYTCKNKKIANYQRS